MQAVRRLTPTVTVLLAIAVGTSTGKLFTDSDTSHYLQLAAGQPVMQPFAARQLGPLIVRGLTHLGLSLHQGFWLLGVLSLAFFVGAVAFLLDRAHSPGWLRWAILGLSFWGLQFGGMVLPDLFYAALLSGFLLLIRSGRHGWASAMLLPLMVARESTVLVLLCWLIAGWRTLNLRVRVGAVAAVMAGGAVVRWLAAGSGGNREGLSPVLYLIGKMPWNFAKNFLGLDAWANLNQACGVPVWHHAVHLGPLHDIGYCRFQPEYPVRLVAYALATFGLLPLLLWWVRKVPREGLLVRFCVLYGVIAYLTAGLLGYSVQRLYGYGWPAFLVGLPWLIGGKTSLNAKVAKGERKGSSSRPLRSSFAAFAFDPFLTPRQTIIFTALSILSSWLEWRLDKLPLLLAELAVWAVGFWLLRHGLQATQRLRGKHSENAPKML